MRHACGLPVLALWLAAIARAPASDALPPRGGEIRLREALVLDSAAGGWIRRGGRASVQADPVAAALAAGRFKTPQAGRRLTDDAGAPAWSAARADEAGAFTGPAFARGYAFVNVPSSEERVAILHARGHAWVEVNGDPHTGDEYEYGYVKVPVKLRRGDNGFLFRGGRGRLEATLISPRAPAQIETADVTLPDLVCGARVDSLGAVVVLNATEATLSGLELRCELPGGRRTVTPLPPLLPLSTRKVGFKLVAPEIAAADGSNVEAALTLARTGSESSPPVDAAKLVLRVRSAAQARKVTFRSGIDGSVQYYGLVAAAKSDGDGARPGLILTLHGAAVEAIGQAQVYGPRPWAHVVAPTNRRPYGFDWEDWGRLDALEVLELATRELRPDPKRTWLTGHSMGGHGAWHLGVTFPDRWAAVAPSAGWVSMLSYANARPLDAATPVATLVQRAAAPSDTLALAPNLARAGMGVYVLHGSVDDNVPVAQARTMRERLGGFHPDFAYYEREGAGHWWGDECCDWSPLMDFLRRHELPDRSEVPRVDFVTMSPGVSSRCHWAEVWSQRAAFRPSEIHLAYDPRRRSFSGTTANVAVLALDVGWVPPGAIAVTLDGRAVAGLSRPQGKGARLWLRREGDSWSAAARPDPAEKGPHRCGPFKEAFRNRVLFVCGTKGTAAENAWALAKARYDAERFWYQGNASVDVLPDTVFDPSAASDRDRNVIVYGHAESHEDWPALLGSSPVQVRRGLAKLGDRTALGGGLACLFVRPRPGSETASVGVVAPTGPAGMRVAATLPYFTSGVAYPDVILVGTGALTDGAAGIVAAGYFGNDWGVASGEFAWKP
jgi:pimeloyl-ACP methyl ester carboxylesterase